ncbi:hypothetical protein CC86DRAFT_375765 [Ophiobolus disseminans]|uniref:Uncharacterized protein n=1 Tax=Ophiobolus disseminans TaxID=1469910 RepID=A0A6A6ZE59_9PLEO|nr:hypothetical protein CC86DRAFT_375765 [Ophiobolus disseminans]
MPNLNWRKPYKYKDNKVVKAPKTLRKEMSAVQRAFVVGAIVASRNGYASARALSNLMPQSRQGLSQLVQRITKRAEESGLSLWDNILYENDLGRGRSALLSQEQKDAIINITTSNRNHREQESWQAIKEGNFNAIAPEMSISTFKNVIEESAINRHCSTTLTNTRNTIASDSTSE